MFGKKTWNKEVTVSIYRHKINACYDQAIHDRNGKIFKFVKAIEKDRQIGKAPEQKLNNFKTYFIHAALFGAVVCNSETLGLTFSRSEFS